MKQACGNGGKEAPSNSSSSRRAFFIDKEDNNAHVGTNKKEKNNGKCRNFL